MAALPHLIRAALPPVSHHSSPPSPQPCTLLHKKHPLFSCPRVHNPPWCGPRSSPFFLLLFMPSAEPPAASPRPAMHMCHAQTNSPPGPHYRTSPHAPVPCSTLCAHLMHPTAPPLAINYKRIQPPHPRPPARFPSPRASPPPPPPSTHPPPFLSPFEAVRHQTSARLLRNALTNSFRHSLVICHFAPSPPL